MPFFSECVKDAVRKRRKNMEEVLYSVCRYFLFGWCRNGKRCEFSNRRPLCRHGDRCRYGRRCRYSHKIIPRVSRVGGTKPGKHNTRNRRCRAKRRRVLIVEAKVSLVIIKELEAQLKLEEEKHEELHDTQKSQERVKNWRYSWKRRCKPSSGS